MERLQSDASHLPEIFNDIARSYTREELRLLRTGRSLTDGVLSKTLTNIKVVVTSLFRNHPKINRLPPRNEFGSTYLFRFFILRLRMGVTLGIGGWRAASKIRKAAK